MFKNNTYKKNKYRITTRNVLDRNNDKNSEIEQHNFLIQTKLNSTTD